ncbi:MAG: exo-alpha-sialidase [bacterium]|nr:exo-alpha-sialidase [bacterium]
MSSVRASLLPLILSLASLAQAQTPRPAQRVNTTGDNSASDNRSDGAGLAVQGARFVAVWCDQFATAAATQDAFVSVSDDDGITWSLPARIDTGDAPNQSDTEEAKVVITDDGTIVAIFEDKKDAAQQGSNNEDLFYNRSTDGGVTWLAAALPLNTPTAGAHVTSDIDRASITTSGNRVFVVWEEDSQAGLGLAEELWFTASGDSGATWSAPFILTTTAAPLPDVDDPKVIASGLNVVVTAISDAGGADDVYVWHSTDGGQSFAMQLVETDTAGDVNGTLASADGDLMVLAWLDNSNFFPGGYAAHALVSLDAGLTWGSEISLSVRVEATQFSNAIWLGIETQGDNVYAVYADDSEAVQATGPSGPTGQAASKVYAAVSNDAGATWSVDVPLDPADARRNNRPSVVATDFQVFVHMETGVNGGNGLAYVVSNDLGQTWLAPSIVVGAGPDVDSEDVHEGRTFAASDLTGTALSLFWDRPTAANELYVAGMEGGFGSIGTNYCGPSLPNSSGLSATIAASGSILAGGNPLTLIARDLPQNQFGYFLAGRTQGFFNPPGSQGFICLNGNIGRYNAPSEIGASGLSGSFQLDIDTNAIPVNPPAPILAGESWNFQAWFRDNNPTLTSNFTDGLEVVLQ